MPLIPSVLTAGLNAWLSPPAVTIVDAATRFSTAYTTYASTATAGGAVMTPVLSGASQIHQASTAATFASGTPISFCQGIQNDLIVFWSTPGLFSPPVVSIGVITPTLAAPLQAALTAGMGGALSPAIAELMTTQLDIWTRTITMLLAVGPPVPLL